jgi:drug/metabolite transporter (DMT)-like permease
MSDEQPILDYRPRDVSRAARRSSTIAVGVLAFCCLCWGFSFPVMQIATHEVEFTHIRSAYDARRDLAIRATFNAWRFGAAAIAYGLVTIARQGRFTRDELVGGIVVGTFFGAGMFLQVLGLKYTRPSVSAFLTALAVVYAPIAQALLLRRAVGGRVWIAVCLAMIGIAVLSQADVASAAANTIATTPPLPYLGEMLTVLAALLFTGQILAIDRFGKTSDPNRLTLVMLLTTAALSLLCGLLLGGAELHERDVLTQLVKSRRFWWSFSTLVIFSSVVALHLMNAWQPLVAPATAAVVYCLEPLFATIFSLAFSTERLMAATLLGGALVLLAVLTVVPWRGSSPPPPPAQSSSSEGAPS